MEIPWVGSRAENEALHIPSFIPALGLSDLISRLSLTAPTALLGMSVSLFVLSHGDYGAFFYPVALSLLIAGMLVKIATGTLQAPSRSTYLFLILLAFVWMSVPGSIWWGSGNWMAQLVYASWMTPFIIFPLVRPSNIMPYIVPGAVAQTVILLYQGMIQGVQRSEGIIHNPNPAAGFLVIVSAYLLTTKLRLLAIPMMASAMLFTGSRWAILVVALLLILVVVRKLVSWRFLLLTSLIVFLFAFVYQDTILPSLRVPYLSGADSASTWGDAGIRLKIERPPSLIPKGDVGSGLGPSHNVPLRIASEAGFLAALIWIGLSLRRMYPLRSWSGMQWAFIALLLLSMMDYYTWIGSLGSMWWALSSTQEESEWKGIQNG